MYKLAGRKKLGRKDSHRRALVRNQVRSLFLSGKLTTTTPKAKVLKANAESYIVELGKMGDDIKKYELNKLLPDSVTVGRVLEYLKGKPVVKMVKIGYRDGDNAQTSKITLLGYTTTTKKPVKTQKSTEKPASKPEDKAATSTEEEATEVMEAKEDRESIKAKNLAKTLKNRFVGKERARTRSGI